MTTLRLRWDANVPSTLQCRCGHPYERHFEVDLDEKVGLVGTAQPCKWCDGDDHCQYFNPESPYGVQIMARVRVAQLRDEVLDLQDKLQQAEYDLFCLESGRS